VKKKALPRAAGSGGPRCAEVNLNLRHMWEQKRTPATEELRLRKRLRSGLVQTLCKISSAPVRRGRFDYVQKLATHVSDTVVERGPWHCGNPRRLNAGQQKP